MMSDNKFVNISDSADQALSEFDFASQGGKNSIRLFLQGYG